MRHFHWQIYWSWWPLFHYNRLPDDFGPTLVFLTIGPIQLRWWSNVK